MAREPDKKKEKKLDLLVTPLTPRRRVDVDLRITTIRPIRSTGLDVIYKKENIKINKCSKLINSKLFNTHMYKTNIAIHMIYYVICG